MRIKKLWKIIRLSKHTVGTTLNSCLPGPNSLRTWQVGDQRLIQTKGIVNGKLVPVLIAQERIAD